MNNHFILNNGVEIPSIGYGTWQTPQEKAADCVAYAIEKGYRHIDTAACYENEVGVGKGVRDSGIDRREIFVTSKVWNTHRGYQKTLAAFEKTMNDLALDYLDLYLIHWPASFSQYENWEEINLETWRALIELYRAGKVRAIGVSNFLPSHLAALMQTEIKPMVNQIEFHPGFMQSEVAEYCQNNGIAIEAWSPLGTGRVLENAVLKELADKYGKSVAQICIRWCLQSDVIPLPKSVTPKRIVENLDVYDFEISKDDIKHINALPYIGGSGLHPDKISF